MDKHEVVENRVMRISKFRLKRVNWEVAKRVLVLIYAPRLV